MRKEHAVQNHLETVAQAVSERLRARRKLVKLAEQIVRQMPEPVVPVGIDDVPYVNCTQPGVIYACGSGIPYNNPSPPYCNASLAFVCQLFQCTQKSQSFVCDNTYDHVCTDLHNCSTFGDFNSHECKAYHGFFCDDDFHCYGDFTCKSPGNKACVPASSYSLEGGKDTTPGDFTCGWPSGNADDFDCNSKFGCTSKDDFRCVNSTDFDCGTSDPADSFNCGSAGGTTQFQCDGSDFTCAPMSKFSCVIEFQCKKSTPFNCSAYSCPQGVTYKNQDW
jgi:hypothetical protein